MRVVWTPEAEQDREEVWDYIASDSAAAAARMDELFSDAAAQLADFPELGRPGKIAGTRELIPHENYRLVYEIDGGTVGCSHWFTPPGCGRHCVTDCAGSRNS